MCADNYRVEFVTEDYIEIRVDSVVYDGMHESKNTIEGWAKWPSG